MAIGSYIGRCSKIPGVLAVATMGSVGAPGLSDIDVIVVVDDNFHKSNSHGLRVKNIDDELFIHGPFIFNKSSALNIQWIIFATNIELRSGYFDFPLFEDLDKKQRCILAACYIIDFCESRTLQFAVADYEGKVDARAWATRTWSVVHSVHLAVCHLGLELSAEEARLLSDVTRLRENWQNFRRMNDIDILDAYKGAKALNRSLFLKALKYLHATDYEIKYKQQSSCIKKLYFGGAVDDFNVEVKKFTLFNRNIYYWNCKHGARFQKHIALYNGTSSDTILEKTMQSRARYVGAHRAWLQKNAKYAKSMGGYIGVDAGTDGRVLGAVKHILYYFAR
ncbi:MAG: hypothetical protein AAGI12_13435 [Pseudomonadota bacterium]